MRRKKREVAVSQLGEFEYENKCIFCANDASDAFAEEQSKDSKEKRNLVSRLQRLDTNDTIINGCIIHEDDWSHDVSTYLS